MNRTANAQTANKRPYALALAIVVLCTALLYVCFPFRLDLNDDVMMKDILSGAYTGVPDGHNIQMLYPLGAFLALLYRIVPRIPWYGVFLLVTQTLCLTLVLGRALAFAKGRAEQIRTVCFFAGVCAALFLPHMVFYQYTVTCALLSGTAAFLLLGGSGTKQDALSLALLLLAYLVRSEMMLLVLPLAGVALLFRTLRQRADAVQSNTPVTEWLKTNVAVVILLIMGLGFCSIANAIAYGSPDWKAFVTLFDNRTELYDFHRLPAYEEHKEFYESIGLSRAEQTLLVNYNYGLDESIDSGTLEAVAAYAAEVERGAQNSTDPVSLISLYLYRLRHLALPKGYLFPQTDMPWNLLTILCYILWVLHLRSVREVWKPLLLFLCRSSLWLFIMARGRDPIRITHGLLLTELLIITSAIILERERISGETEDVRKKITKGMIIAIPVLSLLLFAGSTVRVVQDEITARIETESRFRPLFDYMDEHPADFFCLDVYTWVPYMEGLFVTDDMRPANRDICGGWVCKSPLYREKLAAFSFSGMQEALLEENVYFIQKTESETDWLSAYYGERGIAIEMEETTRIADLYSVYRIRKAD